MKWMDRYITCSRTACARVRPYTCRAPALNNASAQACMVAPLVVTSSTTSTVLPRTKLWACLKCLAYILSPLHCRQTDLTGRILYLHQRSAAGNLPHNPAQAAALIWRLDYIRASSSGQDLSARASEDRISQPSRSTSSISGLDRISPSEISPLYFKLWIALRTGPHIPPNCVTLYKAAGLARQSGHFPGAANFFPHVSHTISWIS